MPSQAELRVYLQMSLAQLRAEGGEFSPEYLADCEAVIRGEMSEDALRTRHIDRVVAQAESMTLRHDPLGNIFDADSEPLIKAIRDGVVASRLRELMAKRSGIAAAA